jgi:lipoprotein-releasing system permease protein
MALCALALSPSASEAVAAVTEPRGFDPTPSLAPGGAARRGAGLGAGGVLPLHPALDAEALRPAGVDAAELLIAVRQLRARKSGFLTVISFLAFLGVGLGSFALCMTISIMGGFGNDLKHKILGNNAHVVVDRERGGFTDWQPAAAHASGRCPR